MNLDNWEIEFELKHRYRGCNERDYHEIKSFISKVASNARTEGQLNAGVDVAKLVEKVREEGRSEWESVNKQYVSRQEAYERGYIAGQNDKENNEKFERRGRQSLIVEAIAGVEKMEKEVPQTWKDKELKWGSIPAPVMARVEYNGALNEVITYLESLKH